MLFVKYHNLENYISTEVKTNFENNKYLTAFDFFCIVIWKANRAKSKVATRLLKHGDNLDESVRNLTNKIFHASSDREKFEILFAQYGFRIPMTTAILSILYPDQFTIYDVRVCESLNEFSELSNKTNFEEVWAEYLKYLEKVKTCESSIMSLRDKDRHLWGLSFYKGLIRDLENNFEKKKDDIDDDVLH
jgi:hypothetical protein